MRSTFSYLPFVRLQMLWVEILICATHCPPYVESRSVCPLILFVLLQVLTSVLDVLFFGSWMFTEMGNIIVYRIETIMCGINLLRVYLVWR
jgi:bacteriorhodopsin